MLSACIICHSVHHGKLNNVLQEVMGTFLVAEILGEPGISLHHCASQPQKLLSGERKGAGVTVISKQSTKKRAG